MVQKRFLTIFSFITFIFSPKNTIVPTQINRIPHFLKEMDPAALVLLIKQQAHTDAPLNTKWYKGAYLVDSVVRRTIAWVIRRATNNRI
jgi:hypothetical protein